MKKENPAHFEQVKSQNSRIVRNLLKETEALSVSKIAEQAGLTYPTVLSLLKELIARGEVKASETTKSSGGRPGVQYELNSEYQYALVMYFDDLDLKCVIYDARGNAVGEKYVHKVTEDIKVSEVVQIVKKMKKEYPTLSTLALGIPGVVCEKEITYLPKFVNLQGKELVKILENELQLKVFIENDINAIAFSESTDRQNFAHIMYVDEDECIGVGIVMQGEVVKGSHGYAGELEYLCADMKNQRDVFVTNIATLTCVLDLPEILISGSFCTEESLVDMIESVKKKIPADRIPDIIIIEDVNGKYEAGLLKRIMGYWKE